MFRWLLAGLAVLSFGAGSAMAAPPPLSAYGKLPAVEDVALSPDGQALAFVYVDGDKRRVFVQTLAGAPLQTISLGEMKTRRLKWAGDKHLLIFVSTTLHRRTADAYKYEMTSAISLNVLTGSAVELLANRTTALGNIVGEYGSAEIDGRTFAFVASQHLNGGASLFKVDLDNGAAAAISNADVHAQTWVLDGQGRIVARLGFSPEAGVWSLYAGASGDQAAFSKPTKIADLDLLGLGRTPDTVLVEDQTGDEDTLLEVPLKPGGKPQVLSDDLRGGRRYFSPDKRVLLGVVDAERGEATFFDPLLKQRFEAARKPFSKYHVSLVSYDAAFDRLVLLAEGGDESGTYWLVDLTTGKATSLGQTYPGIAPADVGPTRLVHYKAADGMEIEGVLTLPPGRKPERLPMVMLPHGGPIGVSDQLGFDWWAQAFASRGYAVLQPNYRGSGGYGGAFRRAGYGEWGKKMQSDLSDGVAYLAAQGTVDPKRVCIVGASYGGYAALAGVTLQHGVYRCAVSYGGVSDLGTMMWRAGHNGTTSLAARREERAMGATWSGDDSLAARSPLHHAAKADAPILLIHGKDDTVVPLSESANMDAVLTRAGKRHAFLKLDGEDHWLSSPATRTQMLQASVDFVMANNPPG